jgi:phosphatidylinositol alpha 1,6-mannosyltransferase
MTQSIRSMVAMEPVLIWEGLTNFRFLIIGQSAEEPWLRANMMSAEFRGMPQGEALAHWSKSTFGKTTMGPIAR